MRVSVKAHSSKSRCQSVELRASREASSAKTAPAFLMETSVTRVLKSFLPAIWAPDIPRSPSSTRTSFQPNSIALSLSAYWRSVLSWWWRTCAIVDWRI